MNPAPAQRDDAAAVTNAGKGRVFVSHAGRDSAWAEWVAWQLRHDGYEVELDRWDWAAGDNFVVRMSQALERAETVVAVVSEAYFEVERFTTPEWTAALAARGRLVVLRVENVPVVPVLRPYVFRDLFGLAEADARQVAVQAVAGPSGPPSQAPAFPGRDERPRHVPADSDSVHQGVIADRTGGPRLPGVLPAVWNAPRSNAVFTGRDSMLVALRQSLTDGNSVQVLHGIGGAGKSTLAIEYAHRFANAYELVWWVDAEQPDRIGEQMAALATASGWVPADTHVPAALKSAEQRLRGMSDWLLIFDNAEDPATLVQWLPPVKRGHVVVTSRNPNWRQLGTPVPVDVFARAESTTLLRRLLPTIGEIDADRVAEALADLPLAVAQAAGTLTETGITASGYLGALAEQTAEVLAEGTPVGYPVPLAASIAVALQRLGDEDRAAVQLLRVCAALAPEPVPADIFITAPVRLLPEPLATVTGSTIALHRSIGRLGRYGLARIADGTIQLHRLTHAILTATDPDRPDTEHRAAALLAEAVPEDDGNQPITWPRWAQLLPHLLHAVPAETDNGDLQGAASRAAWYLLSRGDLRAGLDLAQRLHDRWSDRLGRRHLSTQSAADALSTAYRAVGRYHDAKRLDEEALATDKRELGDDDPNTLVSANNLANDLRGLGEHEQARQLDEDTLARRKRVLGDNHPSTLASASNLAFDLGELGEHERAQELDEDTLARRRRILGNDHPDTLTSASNLAVDLQNLGEHEKARQLDEDTQNRRQRTLGDDSP